MPKYFDAHGRTVHEGAWWTLAKPTIALPAQLLVAGSFLAVKVVSMGAATSIGRVAALLALGFALWTLFEYVVHRWLFHQTGNRALRWMWIHAHKPHHRMRTVADPHHRALHPAIAIPTMLPWYAGAALLGSSENAISLVVGFALGYCAYELQHWLFHATSFPERFGHLTWVKAHHEAHVSHHLTHLQSNFGFTTYFWDRVFGTYVDHGSRSGARGASALLPAARELYEVGRAPAEDPHRSGR